MIAGRKVVFLLIALILITIAAVVLCQNFYVNKLGFSESSNITANSLTVNNSTDSRSISIASPNTIADYALNDSQKSLAEAIARTNPALSGARIGNISVDKVHEESPGVDRVRYLPAVEFITGNESDSGINAYVYVDLTRNRTAYVGYTARYNPADRQHFYSSGPGVIRETVVLDGFINPAPTSYYNYTIVDNGYQDGISEENKVKLLTLAESNETFWQIRKNQTSKGVTSDPSFWVSYTSVMDDRGGYLAGNPCISIVTRGPEGSFYDYETTVYFDGADNSILSVGEWTAPKYI